MADGGSVVSGVVAAIGALSSGYAAVKGAQGVKTPKVKTPVITKPEVMPEKDDAAVRQAAQLAMARRVSAGGRASTILSSDNQTLGA